MKWNNRGYKPNRKTFKELDNGDAHFFCNGRGFDIHTYTSSGPTQKSGGVLFIPTRNDKTTSIQAIYSNSTRVDNKFTSISEIREVYNMSKEEVVKALKIIC